jgi:hypothetical protein
MYKVMQDCDAKWAKLIENTTKIEGAAKKKYNELKFLILYLDQEMVEVPVAQMAQQQQSISADIQKLVEIAAKIKDALKIIEQMVSRGSVEEILGMDDTFKEFERTVQELSYLETLSFDILYKVYQQALLRDNERPLTNFDDDQRDVYMKLKFKALRNNQNPLNIIPPFEEEKKAADIDPQSIDS